MIPSNNFLSRVLELALNFRLKSSIVWIFALIVLGAALAGPSFADSLPQPPAYGVAQRLESEAKAATDPNIVHNRAYQAVHKYEEVVASATYRKSSWAAESLYHEAQLDAKYLDNKYAAIQAFQNLENNYKGIPYAEQGTVRAEKLRVQTELDHENKTTYPWSIAYNIMDFFVKLTGAKSYSYWIAILMISVLVRLAVTPLSNKSFASMKEQQRLQPLIKELNAKYKDDAQTKMRKTQELFAEHGINPAAGCIPMLIQLPIFLLMYRMISLYQYRFVHGTFLWIGSPLSHLYPAILATDLGQQDIPLLVLYALTTYISSKMTMTPSADPAQAEQQKMMSIMMPFMSAYFFMMWHLPSAFALYYIIFNVLSTLQQLYFMRKHDDGSMPEIKSSLSRNGSVATVFDGDNTANASLKSKSNSASPTARGVIAPTKVHPKKKRRS
jgi:YidC/Oxa1 family membrane protein insertase